MACRFPSLPKATRQDVMLLGSGQHPSVLGKVSLGAHWLVPWSKGTAISESDRSCKQSDSIFKRRDTVESSSSRLLVASAIFSACFHHKRCTSCHICASAQAAYHVDHQPRRGSAISTAFYYNVATFVGQPWNINRGTAEENPSK
jgi:hypothetical protein